MIEGFGFYSPSAPAFPVYARNTHEGGRIENQNKPPDS